MAQAIHLMRGIVLNVSYIVIFGLLLLAIKQLYVCMCNDGCILVQEQSACLLASLFITYNLHQPFTPFSGLSMKITRFERYVLVSAVC